MQQTSTRARAVLARGRRDKRDRATPGIREKRRAKLLLRWQEQGRRCAYCGAWPTTVDHVVPLSRGGDSYEGNLVPCCRSCNSSKSDLLLIEWRLGKAHGLTYAKPWREPQPTRKRRVWIGEQIAASVCCICGALYVPTNAGRRTCGATVCMRENLGRRMRDKYRDAHGLPVDPSEPTAYLRKIGLVF